MPSLLGWNRLWILEIMRGSMSSWDPRKHDIGLFLSASTISFYGYVCWKCTESYRSDTILSQHLSISLGVNIGPTACLSISAFSNYVSNNAILCSLDDLNYRADRYSVTQELIPLSCSFTTIKARSNVMVQSFRTLSICFIVSDKIRFIAWNARSIFPRTAITSKNWVFQP